VGVVVGLALVLPGGMLAPALASSARSGQASRAAANVTNLSMTASVSPTQLTVGAQAVYTVTVQNNGNIDASNVTTTLPFTPDGMLTIGSNLPTQCKSSGQVVTCTEKKLPANQAATYEIPVTVLPTVSDGTNIVLRAQATATGVPTAGTNLTTQASTQVDVGIQKTGPSSVIPGGTIDYTYTVTNNGPSNAAGVTWHDATNGNLTTITSYPCGNTGLTASCSLGTLAPGATRTYHLKLTVNPGVSIGTNISSCAVVYTGTSTGTNPGDNQSCTSTMVRPPMSNIRIAQSTPTSVEEGGTVHYSVTATNNGPDPATNLTVSDLIQAPFDSISSLPSHCSLQGGDVVSCTVGTLAVGKAARFSFSVKLSSTVSGGTSILNCAAVTSQNTQVAQQPSPSCQQTQVVSFPMADVGIAATGPATVKPGGSISYTMRVTNQGPDAAENVIIRDPVNQSLVTVTSPPKGCSLAGGTVTCNIGTLAAGAAKTFSFSVRVNADAAANTVIRNCGSIDSVTANPNNGNTTSCVSTTVNGS
jgi:uncharacterized repeat protein (TIGR01451 family)